MPPSQIDIVRAPCAPLPRHPRTGNTIKKQSLKRRLGSEKSDVQVMFHWNRLDLSQLPEFCGVYAITSAKRKEWYYIGKSQNIAKRFEVKNHPFQVTKDIEIDLHYWYLRVDKKHLNWAERYLIKEYDPEWNGGTSFDGYSRWLHCEARLPLTEEQILERSAHLRGIWGD